ncbi:MAG: DNA polymerase III subunit alpha [Legionellaceae bacterium]|nr:DNA polymerase III subunit alpha [Legionellaceae bacterium]MBP9775697.1 DNA polymerase III subunit alpha [Legionellaceae bacterium]
MTEQSQTPEFVHLHVRSEYSIVDSTIRIPTLMSSLVKMNMWAVAVTDFCNLFAGVKVYQAALAAGIKPILGCDILLCDPQNPEQTFACVLLCQSEDGYRNLTRLISRAYQEGQYHGQPRIHYDWLASGTEGLIALSGGFAGNIGQALLQQDSERAQGLAQQWLARFGDRFYLEITRTNRPEEQDYNQRLIGLADLLKIPLVATNDVRFLHAADYDAHEARVCIHQGQTLADERRKKIYSNQQYLRSPSEMAALFADLPQALQNSVEIAKRCTVTLNLGHYSLPNFPTSDGSSVEAYLSLCAQKGLAQRLEQISLAVNLSREAYEQRLQIELDVINPMGFSSYFLIVADFIQWAKANGVPVGPGRGSGAGSLVAYSLGITDLDPLQYDLLFERFLNPERVSMPDFDIDFCMDGRDRVIDYVAEKYGRSAVSQIITFGTMAAKAVVRDVGRVLAHPYGFVDKIAKLIPFEIGITLQEAIKREPELARRYQDEEEVKELLDLALSLEGITRNAGKHAGGVVIAPSELTDFTAIYCEEGSQQLVSQFDKDDVESVGLVKFDFLGLRTLTIIHLALAIINREQQAQGLPDIDIATIPLVDKVSFDLLKACKTTAVFQLESRGMKDLIHRLQPDTFEDVIALVALFRPGPLQSGMVDDFIERKHGLAAIEYLHPDLEPILKPTYGVILYQEQVMQIAQVLAGYTLGAADLLRRAMGKKKPEEMANQRTIFTQGALQRGISLEISTEIFDLMEKFAGYGFNKSHSAAYALIAYQTAWLKAHYPAAFMAAVLSSDMDNTDKVVGFIQECKAMGLTILPPSIQNSEYVFSVVDAQTIRYGMGAIKGLGQAMLENMIEERRKQGPFLSLFDLCRRVDLRKINRRVLEALIKSGSMDIWKIERAGLMQTLDTAMTIGAVHLQNSHTGQRDLFAELEEGPNDTEAYIACVPWSNMQRLTAEKETLGFYVSGHPVDPYEQEFQSFVQPIAQLGRFQAKKVLVCGMVNQSKKILTKRGKSLVIYKVEAAQGFVDVVAFAEILETKTAPIQNGDIILIEGELGQDDFTGGFKIMAAQLFSLEEARMKFARCLRLHLRPEDEKLIPQLKTILQAHQGDCVVQILYANATAKATLNLDKTFAVRPGDQLLSFLKDSLEADRVMLCY